MRRSWRFIVLFILAGLSAMMVVPTLFDLEEDSPFPVKSKINLGLDLQGGLYMVLGIDFQKVYRDEMTGYARRITSFLTSEEEITARMGSLNTEDPSDPKHSIVIEQEEEQQRAKEAIRRFFGPLIRLTTDTRGLLEYGLNTTTKSSIEQQSVSKSIEVIRNRIDEFGVTEPVIIPQGSDRIVIQLPGIRDIERAKALIGQTAKLEFRIVGDTVPPPDLTQWVLKAQRAGITYEKGSRYSDYVEKINAFLKDDLPEGYQLVFQRQRGRLTNEVENQIPFLVEDSTRLTGDALQDARVQIDPQKNQPYVSLEFKSQGGEIFEQITGENIGKPLAVILDGNVYSAPNIQSRIPGGRAQITLGAGGYNTMMREAQDLARVLRAGALPVQLDFLEQRSVGPGLGQDSIIKARFAGLVGITLVFIFIITYYRVSGIVAVACLLLNILFVLSCLISFGATLTLPGIAGIALTVGMAVDANIVIYERIREEVRKGVDNYRAVENGFDRAFWTIVDANITTALAGLCLFNFGTGPIRGFAVTLLIGIVATIYTSYFVGKLLFEFALDRSRGRHLSI